MTKYLEKVLELQIELSNVCNATCLGCVRNSKHFKKYEKHQGKEFLEESLLVDILKTNAGKHIRTLEFCGNVDEPFAHPKFIEILTSISQITTNLNISIHTNGSLRNINYYKRLADVLKLFDYHIVRFSIDGLKDSVYIYRGIKDYNRILNNAKAFIDNGGIASWQMLSFPWNEKEIDECKKLSQDMNFRKFFVRRDRSSASKMKVEDILQNRLVKDNIPPYKPLDTSLPADTGMQQYSKKYTKQDPSISCHFGEYKKMFLDHSGRLWPCCFFGNPEVRHPAAQYEFEYKIYKKYGKNFNNLNEMSFDEALENDWYNEDLTQSWNQPHSLELGCFSMCIQQCSKQSIPIGKHLDDQTNEY